MQMRIVRIWPLDLQTYFEPGCRRCDQNDRGQEIHLLDEASWLRQNLLDRHMGVLNAYQRGVHHVSQRCERLLFSSAIACALRCFLTVMG